MKKELRPPFANNLTKARRALKWSHQKAADMIGVKRKAYQQWEYGNSNPNISLLSLIAYNLKITNLLSFLDNPDFDPADQDGGWEIQLSTPLEERYRDAAPAARTIVDAALGIGQEALTC